MGEAWIHGIFLPLLVLLQQFTSRSPISAAAEHPGHNPLPFRAEAVVLRVSSQAGSHTASDSALPARNPELPGPPETILLTLWPQNYSIPSKKVKPLQEKQLGEMDTQQRSEEQDFWAEVGSAPHWGCLNLPSALGSNLSHQSQLSGQEEKCSSWRSGAELGSWELWVSGGMQKHQQKLCLFNAHCTQFHFVSKASFTPHRWECQELPRLPHQPQIDSNQWKAYPWSLH